MRNDIKKALLEGYKALDNLIHNEKALDQIELAIETLVTTFKHQGRVFSCGNGGSMCDAMHFAQELSGRYRQDRPALAATAISDVTYLTCVGNDYGYEYSFSRFLEGHGRKNDTLLAISTSGKSPNILRAIHTARTLDMKIIALTGHDDCPIAPLVDVHIATPSGQPYADRVQELHIKCIHIMIAGIERQLFGKEA